ncbi:ML domain-containing protein [Chloropicon primus]|uniref:MD-2-related lipid-recognition domain-containing protein n=1 Tax=Chloropicon primus TaxID=1764295 RepID=A0A5B8MRC7_9CHLO|nr:hypothetical protein A3770_06p43200 [Chloropicon primus]UPR01022.1 ML domain-containing protein [Chloropicon primus]|eukprot:QDZ21802.1 hypothetical protein A3770_06p43200 [Chloropicon primus]
MKFALLALVFSATVLAASAQGPQWDYCSGNQYAFELDSVDIEPYPIEKGSDTTFSLSGTSSITVNNADISIKIKKGFITVFHTHLNLCDYYQCPINQGPVSVSLPESIPNEVPKGKYGFQIDITTPSYTGSVVCVDGEFQVE